MLSPVLTPPTDPDFLHVLNRRLEDLSTLIEALDAKSQTAAAAATPATTQPAAESAVASLISTSSGTRKQRLVYVPQQLNGGSTWWETDRGVLYIVDVPTKEQHKWKYMAGTMRGTLSAKPTDLATDDTGLLYYATDYARTFRWTGSAWENAPGETPQGAIAFFDANPGTGWGLADGSTATYSTAVAGTTSKAKPNVIGGYIKGASSYTGTQTAAANGTISGSTASESGHTHSIDHDHPSVTSGGPGTGLAAVSPGSGYLVAHSLHTHDVDLPAYSGTSGAGSSHSHSAGTLAVSGADPAHISGIPYVRL
jgi:hypothetical protein